MLQTHRPTAAGDRRNGARVPKEEGINRWIEQLEEKLRRLGVTIIQEQGVASLVETVDGRVRVHLEDGHEIETGALFWTAPTGLLFKVIDQPVHWNTPEPQRLSITLHHMAFDQDLLAEFSNLLCYDDSVAPWRVTLWQNIQPSRLPNVGHLTAETTACLGNGESATPERIQSDLVRMGVVPQTARLKEYQRQELRGALPIYSRAFEARMHEETEFIESHFQNVIIPNRLSPKTFFSNQTLPSTYGVLQEYLLDTASTPLRTFS